jgi:hypothetical protein
MSQICFRKLRLFWVFYCASRSWRRASSSSQLRRRHPEAFIGALYAYLEGLVQVAWAIGADCLHTVQIHLFGGV